MASVTGTQNSETLNGTSGDDQIFGLAGDDVLNGLGGNDLLDGGEGADRMVGGTGDDSYWVDNAGDEIVEAVGAGFDIVYSSVSYALTAGAWVEVLATANNLATTAINLTGNELDNYITGNAGANTLDGGAGGSDTLWGREGDDSYFVDSNDVAIEYAGQGYDVVYARSSYILAAGVEIEVLATANNLATTAINLTGNELANYLVGNAGANLLDGGAGPDQLWGRGGDDSYYADAGDDVVEYDGDGYDILYARSSYALGIGQSIEVLATIDNTATTAINLTGNALDNYIVGNAGANTLDGGGGSDQLWGREGDDSYIADMNDIVLEYAGHGTDILYAREDYILAAGLSIETLATVDNTATTGIDLYGNELDNYLTGNAGANLLDGGTGSDLLWGRGGDDSYFADGNDVVREDAGQGSDIVYARSSYVLGAGFEIEILGTADNLATTAIDLTGNELANQLIGNAGSNLLDGAAGADILQGRGGADTFAFTTALGGGNVDTIADFAAGVDKIRLGGNAGEPFAALASGVLAAGAFVIGSGALEADDVLIYNSATGALSYDADGNGAGAAVQFATLATGLGLTAGDFVVAGPVNNVPTITSGGTAIIAENSPANSIVYQASATDADGDRIVYSLGGADASRFTIDAGGTVRLIASPDFETKSVYNFTLIASNSGNNSALRPVVLNVTDVNENAATPIINETSAANDGTANAQFIDRNALVIASNPNLPNDSLPSATIQGVISSLGDKDFFAITLQAGEKLVLDVDGTAGGLDSFLRVFGSNGVQILENDDQGTFDAGSQGIATTHNTDSFISFRAATSGTYYFSIESFELSSSGSYKINVSIGPPASQAEIIEEDIQAMLSGDQWSTLNITYSFPNSAGDYAQGFGEGNEEGPEPASFSPFTGTQQAAVQLMLPYIASLTNLSFQQLLDPNDGAAKLRYAMTNATGAAHAYLPGNYDEAGSLWFNKTSFNVPVKGNYAWAGILHETGHALGLKHGHEAPALSADRDSLEYSVMTYRSYPGDSLAGGYSNEQFGYPQTLMMYDIAALQRMYGADYGTNAGNSVYSWSAGTGEMSINGVGQGAPGGNRVFMTVWDGGGIDTYDLSNYGLAAGVTIDLRPGEWTRTSASQLANLGDGHSARGNIANALLFEGNTASAIENAKGGAGHDTLIANLVANQLTGNGGSDAFTWTSVGDAGTGAQADTVLDFQRGADRIDLHNLDTDPSPSQHGSFSFIGTNAFHNVAGEVRYDVIGGSAHIFADADGNGTADMEIILTNITLLSAADFTF